MAVSEKNNGKYIFEDTSQTIIEPKTEDGTTNEISELSKKGYSLLKENKTEEAKEAFNQILSIEDNNNYALVGLGDCERKKGEFKRVINPFSNIVQNRSYSSWDAAFSYTQTHMERSDHHASGR